jgi:hypothetical protein
MTWMGVDRWRECADPWSVTARRIFILACACTAVALAALLPATALAGWQPVGDTATFTDPYLAPAEVGGNLWVARTDPNSSLRVVRLSDDGQSWTEAGNGPISSGNLFSPPALLDVGGVPYVAWTQSNWPDPSQLHVARYDVAADAWVEPEPGSLNVDAGSQAGYPTLAVVGDSVYVGWWEDAPGTAPAQLYVKRLDGSDHWVQPVPGTLKTDPTHDIVDGPHLAAHDGHLFVGWTEHFGVNWNGDGDLMFVKRLSDDGSAWEDASTQPVADNPSDLPTIEGLVSAAGDLYLAEQDWRTYTVRVRRLEGDQPEWRPVGGPLNVYPDGRAGGISITAVGGVPYATWQDGATKDPPEEIHVKRLTASGDEWEELVAGALNDTPGEPAYTPAIAGVGATPYVVWPQLRPNDAVRLYGKRLEPDVTKPDPPDDSDDDAGIAIDGGARFTKDPDVTVDLSAPAGADSVSLSNSADLSGAAEHPLAGGLPWQLDGPDGPVSVYARFGGDARTFSDGIVLDQTPPAIKSAKLKRRGRLRVVARDATSGVRFVQVARRRARTAHRRRYHATITVARSARAVYVRVFDRAGNASSWRRVVRGR